jgi:putative acetyltransferase
MNFRIIEIEARHVAGVVEVVRTVLAEFGLTFGEGSATDAQVLGLPDSHRGAQGEFWVAVTPDERVVGTCGVFPVSPEAFELRKMYLLPETRGAGLGPALLDRAVAFAKARGARHLVLDTVEAMERAIRFYEVNGFVRDDAQLRGSRCTRGYRRDL